MISDQLSFFSGAAAAGAFLSLCNRDTINAGYLAFLAWACWTGRKLPPC